MYTVYTSVVVLNNNVRKYTFYPVLSRPYTEEYLARHRHVTQHVPRGMAPIQRNAVWEYVALRNDHYIFLSASRLFRLFFFGPNGYFGG